MKKSHCKIKNYFTGISYSNEHKNKREIEELHTKTHIIMIKSHLFKKIIFVTKYSYFKSTKKNRLMCA